MVLEELITDEVSVTKWVGGIQLYSWEFGIKPSHPKGQYYPYADWAALIEKKMTTEKFKTTYFSNADGIVGKTLFGEKSGEIYYSWGNEVWPGDCV